MLQMSRATTETVLMSVDCVSILLHRVCKIFLHTSTGRMVPELYGRLSTALDGHKLIMSAGLLSSVFFRFKYLVPSISWKRTQESCLEVEGGKSGTFSYLGMTTTDLSCRATALLTLFASSSSRAFLKNAASNLAFFAFLRKYQNWKCH